MSVFNGVPAVTGDQVNQAFGDAVASIAGGIWQIVSPFLAAVVVLFVVGLFVRSLVSKRR